MAQFDPHKSAPDGILVGSAVFAQLTRVPSTNTPAHTDKHRPSYVRHL